ncbi:MAG: urease accessory protein UreE [Hormoscilla sp. GM7CHS1pb]|nr:urease accessory protein UreE [Hormoscilla sp. GM7CHS1pb]
MLTFTKCLPADPDVAVSFTLALTATERTRSRHRLETPDDCAARSDRVVYLRLPRGTVLRDGDLLQTETGDRLVRVTAKPEPVLNVTSQRSLDLLRAAYHLGNRHVPLEVTPTYLRLESDLVLKTMLAQMGLEVTEAVLPFQPETGAYGHHH